ASGGARGRGGNGRCAARPTGQEPHCSRVGGVRSQAITCVTPDARKAHALLMAAIRASFWVAPSTARQAWRPPKSMQTSQRTAPTWRLDQTMKAISASSTPAVTQEVHFMHGLLREGFEALKRRSTPRRVSTTEPDG